MVIIFLSEKMNTEILGVALQILLLLVISYPLGKHIAKVYKDGNDCMRFMAPIERFIYKLAGINPNEEMDWKAFLKSLLIINVFWFFWGMILLVSQGYLPLNPDGNSGQSPDLAFNTCISFMVNCNLQHYSGESGLTYFTQLFVIMLFQFITAATGMAAMAGNTTNISIRMDADLKAQADALFAELGMNLSTAFNIFVRQSLREGGIPFEVKLEQPNKETIAAMLEAERIAKDPSVKGYNDLDELFADLKK